MKKSFTIKETAELLADSVIAPLYNKRHTLTENAKIVLETLADNDIDVIIETAEGLAFNPRTALSCMDLIEGFSTPQECASALSKAVVPFLEEELKKDRMNDQQSLPASSIE